MCLKYLGDKLGFNLPYFFQSGFWVLLRQGVLMASGLGLMMILTRFISQEILGQYQFFIALISIFSVISMSEMNVPILQGASHGHDGVYKKALKIRLFWSLFGIPLIGLISLYYFYFLGESLLAVALLIIAIFFPLIDPLTSWSSFLMGKKRFDLITLYSSIQSIIIFFTVTISIFIGNGQLIPIVATYLGVNILTNLYFLKKSFKFIKNHQEEKDWKSYGYFLTVISAISNMSSRVDFILVGIFLGVKEVAIYAIGAKFALMLEDLMKTLLTTTAPVIAQTSTLNFKKYFQVFVGTAIMSVVLILIAPWLITLLFTSKYSDSIYLSQIILAFVPFYVISDLYHKHFRFYLKNKKVLALTNISYPLIRIGVMAVLLYAYQIEGLALAQGLRSVILLFLLLLFTYIFASKKQTRVYSPSVVDPDDLTNTAT